MKYATYNGPTDALQIGSDDESPLVLARGERTEVPDDVARRFGERGSLAEYDVTVEDVPDTGGAGTAKQTTTKD